MKSNIRDELRYMEFSDTVRPRDTRPQAARTLTVHVFELGPKKFEIHVGRWSEKRVVYYIKSAN